MFYKANDITSRLKEEPSGTTAYQLPTGKYDWHTEINKNYTYSLDTDRMRRL